MSINKHFYKDTIHLIFLQSFLWLVLHDLGYINQADSIFINNNVKNDNLGLQHASHFKNQLIIVLILGLRIKQCFCAKIILILLRSTKYGLFDLKIIVHLAMMYVGSCFLTGRIKHVRVISECPQDMTLREYS